MNIYKFFIEQFSYQMQNSFNRTKVTTLEEYKKCMTFTGMLTALPILGFVIYLIISGIAINTGLSNFLPEYYLETLFLFFVFFPFVLLIALTSSYISCLIRFFKHGQISWCLSLFTILLINYLLYILCIIKIFSAPKAEF